MFGEDLILEELLGGDDGLVHDLLDGLGAVLALVSTPRRTRGRFGGFLPRRRRRRRRRGRGRRGSGLSSGFQGIFEGRLLGGSQLLVGWGGGRDDLK